MTVRRKADQGGSRRGYGSGAAVLVRRLMLAFAVAAFAGGIGLAAGFLVFAGRVVAVQPPADARADGIVVLTGGRDRIQLAVELLEQGRARRLLISGVHPATTAADIRRLTEAMAALFACCVDLDHQAETTIGNAMETDHWARAHGFRSLIVVTSAYHMPRALAELENSMPDVVLRPYPVRRPELGLEAWYTQPATVKLLLAEYLKYILARARLALPSLGRT